VNIIYCPVFNLKHVSKNEFCPRLQMEPSQLDIVGKSPHMLDLSFTYMNCFMNIDCLYGLVVRIPGCRPRGLGFDS
jgi:hypothetical protein